MAGELQSLLEKINREGVEKARSQADAILSEAKAKAAAATKAAAEEAAAAKAAAEAAAADYAKRAAETIRQAARDIIIETENAISALLLKILREDADKAMSGPETAAAVVEAAVKDIATGGEIASAPAVAEALRRQLAGLGGFTVAGDASLKSGFTVKTEGGRIEHSFTGEAIAAALSRKLRPDLAALLK